MLAMPKHNTIRSLSGRLRHLYNDFFWVLDNSPTCWANVSVKRITNHQEIHCRPRVRTIMFGGHKLGIFFVAGIIQCALWNIQCLCRVIRFHFLVWYKYADFGIVIKSCTAEPGYWQNHVNYILVINASFFLCEGPSRATLIFEVKCAISPFNFGLVLVILLCCIYFETCNINCWKINANDIEMTELFYKPQLWNTNILHVCWPTLQQWFCVAGMRHLVFALGHFSATYEFQ